MQAQMGPPLLTLVIGLFGSPPTDEFRGLRGS